MELVADATENTNMLEEGLLPEQVDIDLRPLAFGQDVNSLLSLPVESRGCGAVALPPQRSTTAGGGDWRWGRELAESPQERH
jgi:hypothetical protein